MHNLRTVVWFELTRTLKKKVFWLSALAFPIIFAAIAGLSYVSNKTADQADDKLSRERFSLVVVDQSGLVIPAIVQAAGGRMGTSAEAAAAEVRSGKVDAAIIYPANPSTGKTHIYAQDAGLTKNSKYESAAGQLLKTSIAASIGSPQKTTLLQSQINTQLTTYDHATETKGLESALAPGIFLVLFYALIVLLGNQMLTSTTEEKENWVIEMILTTVSARVLIIGKIVTMMVLGLIQITAIVAPLVIAYVFFRDGLHISSFDLSQVVLAPDRIILGALLFISGFLLFTGMLVAIGSAMPTAKDAGGFFTFAILIMFAPLYAVVAIVSSPDLLMVKVFSFFPLTAPVTLLLRNAVDNLSTLEAMIGLAILTVSSVLALALAIRAFKSGALRYDSKMSLKELLALSGRRS